MTIYGRTFGVFKCRNNECICNREKTNLHKIKNVVFLISHMWCYDAYFVTNYVIKTSQWRICDEVRVIAPHMRNKKTTFLLLCRFVFSPSRIHSLFLRLNTPKFEHIWSCGGKFEFLWLPVTLSFYPIDSGFHCKYCSSMTKVPVPFWTLLFKIFVLLLKIGVIYAIILSRKVKNTFTGVKI